MAISTNTQKNLHFYWYILITNWIYCFIYVLIIYYIILFIFISLLFKWNVGSSMLVVFVCQQKEQIRVKGVNLSHVVLIIVKRPYMYPCHTDTKLSKYLWKLFQITTSDRREVKWAFSDFTTFRCPRFTPKYKTLGQAKIYNCALPTRLSKYLCLSRNIKNMQV